MYVCAVCVDVSADRDRHWQTLLKLGFQPPGRPCAPSAGPLLSPAPTTAFVAESLPSSAKIIKVFRSKEGSNRSVYWNSEEIQR